MKKIIALILTLSMALSCCGVVAQAKIGDVVGSALHTDIVVYINHYAIPSYVVNGQSVVVAEDLRNFGFDVIWNAYNRTLTINRNSSKVVNPMYVGKGYTTGTKYANILSTDITVWAAGKRINSFALNGYTMIPVEELTMFGSVNWIANERALKMWVDGLHVLESKQPVSKRYYPGTNIPDFGWVTESISLGTEDDITLYISSGAKVQQYISYITKNGWKYNISKKNSDGTWSLGYINKSSRTGVAIIEIEGLVQVQIGTNIDGWE